VRKREGKKNSEFRREETTDFVDCTD